MSKTVTRDNFGDYAQWYTESGNIQRMQPHEGDPNTTSTIFRRRIEAYLSRWKWAGENDWDVFIANYYLYYWDIPKFYAVFQIKTNDESNFII